MNFKCVLFRLLPTQLHPNSWISMEVFHVVCKNEEKNKLEDKERNLHTTRKVCMEVQLLGCS